MNVLLGMSGHCNNMPVAKPQVGSMLQRNGVWWALLRACCCFRLLAITTATAADYQVSTQAGFDQLNLIDFQPGDRIFLDGGMTFSGGLYFDAADSGADASGNLIAPVVLTSSGDGRATIKAAAGVAIYAFNCGGLEISRLNLVGAGVAADGSTTVNASGLQFHTDAPGNVKFQHLRIEQVQVSGFGDRGIVIGGSNGSSGYHDVLLTDVVASGNRNNGIETFGPIDVTDALTQVRIIRCHARDQTGIPGLPKNSGSGIVLGGVDGGLIEHCSASNNGLNNTASEGPVGIWAYTSRNIIIQHNESFSNRTSGGDGGGFDLDIGVTSSVMQYNFSHDNSGAGFLVYGRADSALNQGNIVRYNISENDGRDPVTVTASGISVLNHVRDLIIHNNTVRLAAPPGGTPIPAVNVMPLLLNPDGITLSNNIFVTTGEARLVDQGSSGKVLFAGNNYWAEGSAFVIRDKTTNYASLSSWRAATGQESLAGQPVGLTSDPAFKEPPVDGDAEIGRLVGFQLEKFSPLVDQGIEIGDIEPGPSDFFRNELPQGDALDIGAHEGGSGPPIILDVRHDPAGPSVIIRYQSEFGVSFAVSRSPTLGGAPPSDWVSLPDTALGDGSVLEYTDLPPPGPMHFYVLGRR